MNIYSSFVTKYEKTIILGIRSNLICHGSDILYEINTTKEEYNPLKIAEKEYYLGLLDDLFVVERKYPNGKKRKVKLKNLRKI